MISRDTKMGTKCVVIANNSRHNRPIGTVITINTFYNNGGHNDGFTSKEFGHTYFALNDLKLWEQGEKDLKEDLSELNMKIKEVKAKIKYLNETGEKVVNLDDYKTYRLNNIIADGDLSSEEKTELILNLMGEGKKKKFKVIKKKPLKDVAESDEVEEMEDEVDYEDPQAGDQGYYHDETLDEVMECDGAEG